MPKNYLPSDRNAAEVADSPCAFFMVKTALTVTSTVGTVTLYGPPIPGNVTTPDTAATATGAKRPGHRLVIWRLTGGTNAAGGTVSAAYFEFKTTGTGTGIIARVPRVLNLGTTGGWGIQSNEMITPFAPTGFPIVIGDVGEGITIVANASGSDGSDTIPVEALCSMVYNEIPTVL